MLLNVLVNLLVLSCVLTPPELVEPGDYQIIQGERTQAARQAAVEHEREDVLSAHEICNSEQPDYHRVAADALKYLDLNRPRACILTPPFIYISTSR